MYRRHYTLSDLPMIPQLRMGACVMLTALADLLYAASSALASLSWRVEAVAYDVCPLPEPILDEPPVPAFRSINWEGDCFMDADTEVCLHLDPMADTAIAPAISERPILATLADCRAAFCEPKTEPAASPIPAALAPVATLADCRESFRAPLPSWVEMSDSGEAQNRIEISNRLTTSRITSALLARNPLRS